MMALNNIPITFPKGVFDTFPKMAMVVELIQNLFAQRTEEV